MNDTTVRTEWPAARDLFMQLADPKGRIESIDEVVRYKGPAMLRDVTVRLRASHDSEICYFRVVAPRKGTLLDIIPKGDGVRLASHHEHARIMQQMLFLSYVSVWSTAIVSVDEESDFDNEMYRGLEKLMKTMGESWIRVDLTKKVRKKARRTLKRVRMRCPSARFEKNRVRMLSSLYAIARTRYLVLLVAEVQPNQNSDPTRSDADSGDDCVLTIRYTYHQNLSNSPDRGRSFRSAIRGGVIRHSHGLHPPTSRAHVPLAKLTSHYRGYIEAPDGYFIFQTNTIVGAKVRKDAENAAETLARANRDAAALPNLIKCNSMVSQTRRALFSISGADKVDGRVYISASFDERPDRSTMAVLASSIIVVAAILISFFVGPPNNASSDIPALVLAITGGGTLATEAIMSGRFGQGFPLMPRYMAYTFALLAICFSLWLAFTPGGHGEIGDLFHLIRDGEILRASGSVVACLSVLLLVVLLLAWLRLLYRYFYSDRKRLTSARVSLIVEED